MKKDQLKKESVKLIRYGNSKKTWQQYDAKRAQILAAIDKFETRISGKRGAEDNRDRLFTALEKLYAKAAPAAHWKHEFRLDMWKSAQAKAMAAKAGQRSDEHGSYTRGDHISVIGLDFVGHWESAKAPYFDTGGEGLGLVEVERERVYAKSSGWRPSTARTKFLVGKNEIGTYFAHPVSPNANTLEEALQWIWNGKAYNIIQRQGDIALISGNGGPKMPQLPAGHRVSGNIITHETHPDLPMPSGKGERIIVGKRAAERASEATRD